ncbi:MAG TPA: GNAT family N-acetyltransferase [Gaiellaceae bacterium]|nr:GNAT family N-acetyltransferase [Gaiellaceae bacterium]
MSLEARSDAESAVLVRPLLTDDLDAADRVMRVAFATFRGLPDPSAAFGDSESVRTRYRAAPECAWAAEVNGEVVGSVFAARWGSFGFFGPLTVRPDLWDRSIGSRLLQPVLEAFALWDVRQAALFTFASSPKHLGLYQKHGFWPGTLTAVTAKATAPPPIHAYTLFSSETSGRHGHVLDEIRGLTDQVFHGLDLEREIVAAHSQGIGDTILMLGEATLEGMAVCHCGAGSEAGSGTCYVKFAAVRPGDGAPERFERLLDACEAFAAESGLSRLVAGVNTGRLDAYRRMLARGFRTELIGVSMRLRPEGPHFDTPRHYVIDDLR